MTRKLSVLLAAVLVLVAAPVAASGEGWIGVSATYELTSVDESADGVVVARTQVAEATVQSVERGRLLIAVTTTEGDTVTAATYRVPISSVVRSQALKRGEFTRAATADGTSISVVGKANGPWLQSLVTDLQRADGSTFQLSVSLRATAGSPPAGGKFASLLPTLIAPDEGVELVEGGSPEGELHEMLEEGTGISRSTEVVAAAAASTKFAYSDIRVKDNRTANITVAYSDLSARGYADSSGLFYNWGGSLGTTTSINWGLSHKSVTGYLISNRTSAVVEGNANFDGVFPLSTCIAWRSHHWHKHQIYTSQHRTWLQNTIWANCGGGVWSFWNQDYPHQGGWYAGGSRQKLLKYVL